MTARDLWHEGTPRAKERPRLGRTRGDGSVTVYTPERTRDEEELIGWEWITKHGKREPYTGDVSLTLVFVGGAGDVDNCAKTVLDALNLVAYLDDRQVVRLRAWKLPAGCGVARGTYVRVERLPKGWRGRLARWLVAALERGTR